MLLYFFSLSQSPPLSFPHSTRATHTHLEKYSFYTKSPTVSDALLEFPPSVAVLLVHQEVEVVLLDMAGLCVCVCVEG